MLICGVFFLISSDSIEFDSSLLMHLIIQTSFLYQNKLCLLL